MHPEKIYHAGGARVMVAGWPLVYFYSIKCFIQSEVGANTANEGGSDQLNKYMKHSLE